MGFSTQWLGHVTGYKEVTVISLQHIVVMIENKQFDAALQALDVAHDTFHDRPLLHARIHALWIKCLWSKSRFKQEISTFSFQLLALFFSLPVSLIEQTLGNVKKQ